jgi:hypothetical protein
MTIPTNTGEFVRQFQIYLDCFVVIGGTPTVLYITEREGKSPRATEDLDIVILDLSDEKRQAAFIGAFKKYVEENGYERKTLASRKSQAYRYTDPKSSLAPKIIEIASRRIEGVPTDQAAQRLEQFEMSAMVCEPYFMDLLKTQIEHLKIADGLMLPVPKAALLILMKAYAALNLEKSTNPNDHRKFKKHLNDIARLTRVLTEEDSLAVPSDAYVHLDSLLKDKARYFDINRLDSCGWKGKNAGERFEKQLRERIIYESK